MAVVDLLDASGDAAQLGEIVRRVHRERPAAAVELLGHGSYDDMQWWSLAYAQAARVLNDTSLLQTSRQVFEHVWATASENATCGGGVWWSSNRKYKNAITNTLAISNAALLHRLTGDKLYLQRALTLWEWFAHSEMRNPELGLIADGLNTPGSCTRTGGACCSGYWTYNQGVLLGGLVDLHAATGNASLLVYAGALANATATHLATGGVLSERSDPEINNEDHALFKGIFMRNLGRLRREGNASAALSAFICANARSARTHAVTADGRFGSLWAGPVDPNAAPCTQPGRGTPCGNATGPAPQVSALMLLVAAAGCAAS
jgi:predicted alpha-1,6-mannanase (GH76 family)